MEAELNKFNREGFQPVEFNPDDRCNVSNEVIMSQVATNIRRQLPQAYRHHINKETVLLVCGGPSLEKTKKELIEAYWDGGKVVALNGSYQWCIDNNIKPSVMVMLDARQFNSRFVKIPVPGCRYLLASQCHPEAFDLCEERDVVIWHCCSCGEEELEMLKRYYFDLLNPIPLGTTVAIKAIQLLNLLGFKSFDIFGLDSCWMDDDHHHAEHHAYPQQENDKDKYMPVWLTPEGHSELAELFYCAPWMMRQAVDFQNLVHQHGNDFRLNVRGEGLIAATMRLSAKLGLSSTITEGD